MIQYTGDLASLTPEQIQGFFVGWEHPFPPETHLRMLAESDLAQVAIDTETGRVVGFIAALTDNVQGAFITLLEVLPEYQGQGVGKALVTQMLDRLSHIQTIELMCDEHLVPFYAQFGMKRSGGMVLRRREP
ncbi:MAG: GNAT family N-acetyltransferase [Thermomicrobiales bacterium]|nr:GNAT family N-acetyltransferase [Thermomicrobiales bacterium]